MRIFLAKGEFTLEIVDDGQEFNPLDVPEADTASKMDERAIGGLGIHLVRNLMDEMKYAYRNKKNHLIMKMKIKEI